jgi:predicted ribosome quality control (RQC) complex YloA/Tae2 family protein
MTTRWDPILTAAIGAELNNALSGARLKGIFLDHGSETLHVYFREATVLVDLAPSRLGLEILEGSEPPEGSRTFPCTLAAVEHIPDERVLVFVLARIRGRGGAVRIVVEFVPGRSNATVVEGDDWTVRHVLVSRSGARAPRIGSPYPRPVSDRRGVDAPLGLQDWLDVLGSEESLKERKRSLLQQIAFTSPINAPALLGDAEGPAEGTSLEDGYELWRHLREVGLGTDVGDSSGGGVGGSPQADAGRSSQEAFTLECEWGDQPYPVLLPGYGHRTSESLLAAVEEVRRAAGAGAVLTPSKWTDALQGALRAVQKKHGKLERELGATPDPQTLRTQGDMILSHLRLVKKGAAEVTLPGFEGTPQTIVLDPKLSPQENAERFYDRAGRAERARMRLPALIEEAESRVAELGDLLERARAGEASADEIRDALPESGPGSEGTPDAPGPSLPYRRYWTSGGLEVRVGRGSKHNDQLTFKHSAPNDIWLHARHSAGAHVVLRWTGGETPPARDLEQAAILAALHSKARSSGSVPVDWTRRKYVRKPRKAPPGSVQLDRAKTLFVEPDPSLPDRLKEPKA